MSHELPKVLIVDDEVCYAQDIALALKKDFDCEVVPDAEAGMNRFRRATFDLLLLDIDLRASENGIDLLRKMKELEPGVPAIMLTKVAELESIVASIKAGAFYYVLKGTGSVIH